MVKKAVMLCVVVLLAISTLVSGQSCSTNADCHGAMCVDNYYYNASLCFQGQCAPLLYSGNPCSSPFATAIVTPVFATSTSSPFGITIWTSEAADCRYSVMLPKDYDLMIPFDQTGSILHSIPSYSPAFDRTPFFTNCRASGSIYSGRFDLVKDASAAVISAKAVPDLITDLPLMTSVIVNSNEPVVCRYDVAKSSYAEMDTYLSGQDENNASSYSDKITHQLSGLSDQTTYALNISCKNFAGLVSPTARVTFSVNTGVEGQIVNTTPEDNSILSQTSMYIEAYTTRSSICYYGNSTNPTTLIDSTEGLHHKSSAIYINPGKYSFYIMCSFKEGQQLKTVPVDFIIDLTPPELILVNDSPSTGQKYTFSRATLSAKWEFKDPESGIEDYNYSISDSYYGQETVWTETTSNQVTLNQLNLTNGKTYYFNVKAMNGAGMWSAIGRSQGITVDLSKSPVGCANTIMDGNETDIDCGGSCALCASGKMCESARDCKTGYCNINYVCSVPSCNDSIRNQDETDIDCGGSCSKCGASDQCFRDSDCESQNCINYICVGTQNTCVNGLLDAGETDVDCGGICASLKGLKCTNGKACGVDDDCMSGTCGAAMTCAKPGDIDGDGTPDAIDNCPNIANTDQKDNDNDGIGDICDDDNDNDAIPDAWETSNGLNAYDASDAGLDNDNDGLTNLQEFESNIDPNNPDSDGDSIADKEEIDSGSSPSDPDSKPRSPFMIILIVGLSFGAIIVLFGVIYYKKAIAPAKIKPISKLTPFEKTEWKPQAVEPEESKQQKINRHHAFEMKHEKAVSGMKRVFRTFEDKSEKKVELPKPTDNIFDKFAEIPVKSGEEVFNEIRKSLEGKNGKQS